MAEDADVGEACPKAVADAVVKMTADCRVTVESAVADCEQDRAAERVVAKHLRADVARLRDEIRPPWYRLLAAGLLATGGGAAVGAGAGAAGGAISGRGASDGAVVGLAVGAVVAAVAVTVYEVAR